MQGSVKAPDTIKISGRFCQQLNKTNKILNILLVRNHTQRDNIITHEYRKCINDFPPYYLQKYTKPGKSLGSQALKFKNPRLNQNMLAYSCCL